MEAIGFVFKWMFYLSIIAVVAPTVLAGIYFILKGIYKLLGKIMILIGIFLLSSTILNAQNAKVTPSGNYEATTKAQTPGILVNKTFTTAKGEVFPVLKNNTGKLYVVKISKKTGKEYKMYLKL